MSRVLVVDDDEAQVELIKTYLEDAIDEVTCVTDSRRVESEFAAFEPDLIVLDVHMPPPDGFEVLRRLRGARESLGFLPILVLGADTSHVTRNTALSSWGPRVVVAGCGEFVNKPIDRDGLVLRVRSLLRTREAFEEARLRHAPAG